MTATRFGIAVGAFLALTWAWLGFGPFVVVALGMAIGALVGRIVEGKLDLSSLAGVLSGKRSSS